MKSKKTVLLPKDFSNMEKMGENIKLARLRRGLTTVQISERAGVARSTLNLIEKGDPGVSIGNYVNVLKTLGLQQDIFNIALIDEFGQKLQDLKLLNGVEKESTMLKESRKLFNKIRLGIFKGSYNSELEYIVGKNVSDLILYLENNEYGFKIDNNLLDIDHIIPLDNIIHEEDIWLFNHYSNLQLLPSEYNRDIKKTKDWDKDHFENWYNNI